jgi:hypothetical protein
VKLELVLVALVALLGCNRGAEKAAGTEKEAVRQAVVDHLGKRGDMNLSTMAIDVASVDFQGDEAKAIVSFSPKGQDGGGMSMTYELEKQEGRWVVKGRGAGGQGHGEMAPSMSPMPDVTTPPGPGGQPALPPGHPPVTETPKK